MRSGHNLLRVGRARHAKSRFVDALAKEIAMGIGLGILLVVLGLILVLNVVTFDLGFVDDNALGWILLLVGALAIALPLIMNAQRSRTKHVDERRYDGPPPA
jgi:hypothetical protein